MTVIADTSGVLTLVDRDAREHEAAHAAVSGSSDQLVLSPLVLVEIDYMINAKQGVDAEIAFLEEVHYRTFTLASWDEDDHALALGVVKRYRDLDIGIADASNVVLAARYRTTTLLTLDQHFRAVRPLSEERDAFSLLPADA